MIKVEPRVLTFEVTRRCNLKCKHCMRGSSQNLDLDLSLVDKVLPYLQYIYFISFTGGEPTLNVDAIEYILDKIAISGLDMYSFDIVSNGYDRDKLESLIILLKSFSAYFKEHNNSRLAISSDSFHKKIKLPSVDVPFKIMYKQNLEEILNLGRARNLDCDKVEAYPYKPRVVYFGQDEDGVDYIQLHSSIVISCDGSVRFTVDYEYDSDFGIIGNLNNDSLSCILEKYLVKTYGVDWRLHPEIQLPFRR